MFVACVRNRTIQSRFYLKYIHTLNSLFHRFSFISVISFMLHFVQSQPNSHILLMIFVNICQIAKSINFSSFENSFLSPSQFESFQCVHCNPLCCMNVFIVGISFIISIWFVLKYTAQNCDFAHKNIYMEN